MSVMWKYLDKRNAAIQVLEDFGDMQFIIENTPEELRMAQEKMISLGGMNMDGLPHSHNPKVGEDRIIEGIEKVDILKERYRQAVEYMAWFKPAWEKLDEDERFILETFFQENDYGADAIGVISSHFNIERNSAYKKKNRALDHLVLLLYGKA